MKAKDVMEPITDALAPTDTLAEAVAKMRATPRRRNPGTRGLVVVDGRGRLVGILSQKNVLRAVLPHAIGVELADLAWEGLFRERARAAGGMLVRDAMTTDVVTVREDDPVLLCLDLLLERNLQRLPVVDRMGRVVGMVLIRDVYDAVTQLFAPAGAPGAAGGGGGQRSQAGKPGKP